MARRSARPARRQRRRAPLKTASPPLPCKLLAERVVTATSAAGCDHSLHFSSPAHPFRGNFLPPLHAVSRLFNIGLEVRRCPSFNSIHNHDPTRLPPPQ